MPRQNTPATPPATSAPIARRAVVRVKYKTVINATAYPQVAQMSCCDVMCPLAA
jgi:hypothetical protein